MMTEYLPAAKALLKFVPLGWPPDYQGSLESQKTHSLSCLPPFTTTQGLATIPKSQRAVIFQEHSPVHLLIRRFVLWCDS